MTQIWTPGGTVDTDRVSSPLPLPDVNRKRTVTLRSKVPLAFKGYYTGDANSPSGRPQVSQVWEHYTSHLRVLASIDETLQWGELLHVSLSYPNKLPPWRIVREVKDVFFGEDHDAMMVLPRAELYVNVHNFCFHLWQTPQGWDLM